MADLPPTQRVLDALDAHGCRPKRSGAGWVARCPAHEDRNPSLSIAEGNDGGAVMRCHAGCPIDTITDALGLKVADLMPPRPSPNGSAPRIVARYPYTDEHGVELYRVLRYDPKRFTQQAADGTHSVAGVRRVPYHLPELLAGIADGATVFITEGEKDCDELRARGWVATTNAGGAGQWRAEWADLFDGAAVAIVCDRDPAGYARAHQIAGQLTGHATTIDVFEPVEGNDVSDHLAAGHDVEALVCIDLNDRPDTPTDEPPDLTDNDHELPTITDIAVKVSEFVLGDEFVLNVPDTIAARWGHDDQIAWAAGESLLLVGPPGVGKTTIATQLVASLMGVLPPELFGLPIEPCDRVLYLACDRPRQIARSMRRLFTDDDRDALRDRLTVRPGPTLTDLAKYPRLFTELAVEAKADVIVIDSLKDVASPLSADDVAGALNIAMQHTLNAGIDVLATHHQRKRQQGSGPPKALDDVYGSTWITAGAGSVMLLWGEAGDPIVQLRHLKQPAEPVGPWDVAHEDGLSTIALGPADPYTVLKNQPGLTSRELARIINEGNEPNAKEVARAKRKLAGLVKRGVATCIEGSAGGRGDSKNPSRYYLTAAEPDDGQAF